MKDLHWFIILGSVLITPLLPYLLKARCPGCGKRKMQSLDTLKQACGEGEAPSYVTFHRCEHCRSLFSQIRSGPLTPAQEDEYKALLSDRLESELTAGV